MEFPDGLEKNLPFCKYHGAGNDVIMIDNTNGQFDRFRTNQQLIRHMCSRRLGVGADGLVEIRRHATCDFEMVFFRASGEQGTFGGNDGRCSVAFSFFKGITKKSKVTFAASMAYIRRCLMKSLQQLR